MKIALTILITTCVLTFSAYAGQTEANLCAEKLKSNSKKIYERVLPNFILGDRELNKKMIRATLKSMISVDEIDSWGAKGEAKEAVECLKKMKS
jgi:hypothetical protein